MPSKLLVAAADAAYEVRHAGRFGIDVDESGWRVSGSDVMARVRALRDDFVAGVLASIDRMPREDRIAGAARFTGPTTLVVDGAITIEAKAVVIATGSHPWMPPNLEHLRDDVITSDDVFELADIPKSIGIFGTGIIGLELGQALHRLGTRVVFFNPQRNLGFLQDPDTSKALRSELDAQFPLRLGTQTEVRRVEEGFEVAWTDNGEPKSDRFERIMAAAGRRPNVSQIGLDASGLHVNEQGIPLHDRHTMRCSDSAVFIAGDVCGHSPVLHEASDEGSIAGQNAARYPDVQPASRRTPLGIAFTHPQMAFVGTRYQELDLASIVVGEVSYENQGRARVIGQNRGLARLYAEKSTCKLLGAELLAPHAEHLAHLLAWSVAQELTVQQMLRMPFYHPVLEEGLRTALRSCARKLAVEGQCPPEDLESAVGH